MALKMGNRQPRMRPTTKMTGSARFEFLPGDDPEGRLFGADIVGNLFGYAQLTNTRVLALMGDPACQRLRASVFLFVSCGEKRVPELGPSK